jgi:two-component system, NtrC family, response regulator AtoC
MIFTKKQPHIVIIEDDIAFNKLLSTYLSSKEYNNISSYYSGEECLEKLLRKPDIVLQDFELPGMNGIETMKLIKKKYPYSIFIFLSGQSNISIVVDAMKQGAYDYIVKNAFAKEDALNKIKNITTTEALRNEKKFYKYTLIIFITALIVSWFAFFVVFRFNK